jgi:hypothetical protein
VFDASKDSTGGIYYGIGAGYEFPIGLIAGLSYDTYVSQTKYSEAGEWLKMDYTYHIITLNVGYKIKL